jgi:hypothetical protein
MVLRRHDRGAEVQTLLVYPGYNQAGKNTSHVSNARLCSAMGQNGMAAMLAHGACQHQLLISSALSPDQFTALGGCFLHLLKLRPAREGQGTA